MDILPEEFDEYIIQEEPIPYNPILDNIKTRMKNQKISTLDFLKMLERKKRLEMVDILRGAKPIPIDYDEIKTIGDILKMKKGEIFDLWKEIFTNHLKNNGFNFEKNSNLLDEMFKGAKKYLEKTI